MARRRLAPLTTFGIPFIGGGMVFPVLGNPWFVDPTNGKDGNNGYEQDKPIQTFAEAVDRAEANDIILLGPGQYDESFTWARTDAANVIVIGLGGRGAAYLDPSTEDSDGLIVNQDDITFVNVGIAAEDSTAGNVALEVTGSRFRAFGCKIEGGAKQLVFGPGTIAQEAAGTHGVGGDGLFYDVEFCWGTDGVHLTCTDYGAATQIRFQKCRFHNLSGKHITETVGSGGAASVAFQNLQVVDCDFDDLDDGTAPTNYIDLNGDNANTGIVTRCSFPTAINSGLNLVSTAVHWVSNYHTGGISTGQPS